MDAELQLEKIRKAVEKRERKLMNNPTTAQLHEAVNRARSFASAQEHELIQTYNFLRSIYDNATATDRPATNEVNFSELTDHIRRIESFLNVPKSLRKIGTDET